MHVLGLHVGPVQFGLPAGGEVDVVGPQLRVEVEPGQELAGFEHVVQHLPKDFLLDAGLSLPGLPDPGLYVPVEQLPVDRLLVYFLANLLNL